MIEVVSFKSDLPGQRVLVLGAVHGNEHCGTKAIQRAIKELSSGHRKLIGGEVTFAPICNPKAYVEDKRFLKTNLNRIIVDSSDSVDEEDLLGVEIARLIRSHDCVLDLHSFTAAGKPFAIQELSSPAQLEFVKILRVSTVISDLASVVSAVKAGSTTVYYAAMHNIPGVVLECGQHNDPKAVEYAYQAISNILFHRLEPLASIEHFAITDVCIKNVEGDFVKKFEHLDPVDAGEVITSTGLKSPYSGRIVLPNPNATIGNEWYYIAKGDGHL